MQPLPDCTTRNGSVPLYKAIALFGLGLAPSVIHQWADEESYLPICQAMVPQTSVLAMDPEVSHDSALALLSQSGFLEASLLNSVPL